MNQNIKRILSKIGLLSPIEQLFYDEKEMKDIKKRFPQKLTWRNIKNKGKKWCIYCGWNYNHKTDTRCENGELKLT